MVKAVRMSTPLLITAIKGDLVTLSICLWVMVRDKRTVKKQKVGKDTKGYKCGSDQVETVKEILGLQQLTTTQHNNNNDKNAIYPHVLKNFIHSIDNI